MWTFIPHSGSEREGSRCVHGSHSEGAPRKLKQYTVTGWCPCLWPFSSIWKTNVSFSGNIVWQECVHCHSFSSNHPHPIQNNRRTLTILGSVDRLKWLMCVAVTDSRQSTSNSTVVPQGICPRWRWNLSGCVQFPERELPAMQIKNCWSTDKEVLGKWPPDCNSASN